MVPLFALFSRGTTFSRTQRGQSGPGDPASMQGEHPRAQGAVSEAISRKCQKPYHCCRTRANIPTCRGLRRYHLRVDQCRESCSGRRMCWMYCVEETCTKLE